MHPGQTTGLENELNLINYPLEEVREKSGVSYFTNSVAYMLAYAYVYEVEKVFIYGVDMEASEYTFERPCVLYWIGFLRGSGIPVELSNYLDKPVFRYGYDQEAQDRMLQRVTERKELTQSYIQYYRDNELPEKKKFLNQYLGRYSDLRFWEQELKG
jgi:hypothetical protein